MGLAATQARLLFITARQNDVSAKMQKVSNDTLILARDKEEIATNYDKMVNNQSYTYTNSDGTNISYDALMGQTAAVNGVTNIVTNGERVVLSQSLASKLGLTQPEGTAKDFKTLYPNVEALINVAEPEAAEKINAAKEPEKVTETNALTDADKSALNEFKKTYGSYPDKTSTTSMSEILSAMGNYSVANISATDNTDNLNGITEQKLVENSEVQSFSNILYSGGGTYLYVLGKYIDVKDSEVPSKAAEACNNLKNVANDIGTKMKNAAGISASQALNKEIEAIYQEAKNSVSNIKANTDINDAGNRDGNEKKSICIATMSAADTVFGFGVDDSGDDSLLFFTDLSCLTRRLMCAMFAGDTDVLSVSSKSGTNTSQYGESKNDKKVNVTNVYSFKFAGNTDDDPNVKAAQAELDEINAKLDPKSDEYWNMTSYERSQLTFEKIRAQSKLYAAKRAAAMNTGFTLTRNAEGYSISEYENFLKSNAATRDIYSSKTDAALEYLGKKSASEPSSTTPDENSQEYYDNLKSYYTTLWNQLSTKGWTTQSAETIQENLNNGLYYISNRPMSSSNNFKAVSDPNANAKADSYYESEMAKLNMKEKQLDTKLQKLQTEYSALTTDLESVKSILNANIQKSFVYCQNG